MEVLLMRINKLIYGGPTFMKLCEKICKENSCPLPQQEILQTNAKFIQKIMHTNEPISIHKNILKPNRATSLIYQSHPKIKLYRTPLGHYTTSYLQLWSIWSRKLFRKAKKNRPWVQTRGLIMHHSYIFSNQRQLKFRLWQLTHANTRHT